MTDTCLTPMVTYDLMAFSTFAAALLFTLVALVADVFGDQSTLVLDRHGIFLFAGLALLVLQGMGITNLLRQAGCV